MNLHDPGRILCRDDSRLPRMLIGNDAADMNDPVADNDTEPEWRPVGFSIEVMMWLRM
jgi:hypothetical protein